jgi:hypothetical protein
MIPRFESGAIFVGNHAGTCALRATGVPNSWAKLPVVLDFFTRLGIVWPLAHRDDWPLISGRGRCDP